MAEKLVLIVEDSKDTFEDCEEQIMEESEYRNQIKKIDWAQSVQEAKEFIENNDKDYHIFVIDRNLPDVKGGEPESMYSYNLLQFLRDHPVYGIDNEPNVLFSSAEEGTIKSLLAADDIYISKKRTHLKYTDSLIEKFDPLFKEGNEKNKRLIQLIGHSYRTIGDILGQSGKKKLLRIANIIDEEKKGEIDNALGDIRKIRDNLLKEHYRKVDCELKFTKDHNGCDQPIINENGIFNPNNYLLELKNSGIVDNKLNILLFRGINPILNTFGPHEGMDISSWVDINMVRTCLFSICNLAEVLYDDIKRRERSQG